ncbi:hypothetical protein ACUNWD_03915 [Sunxiuqinia sp. A32]|uniref:hypothetical protein n=1 Tax=Sunxiuqinia sp. A32 TaxID=3461496 RepID=UPI0040453945
MILSLIFIIACNVSPDGDEEISGRKEITITPDKYVEELDAELFDCSGLMWFQNRMWIINDSGGENQLYGIGSNGEIEVAVTIDDARNTDWESIAQDEDYIYFGDFGNKNGNRTELKVYRVSKEDLNLAENETSVDSDVIKFFYADQEDYSLNQNNTEYDCGAMIAYGNNLYLFSKDWVHGQTKVYELSNDPGEYELYPVDSFQVNGLVTGADIRGNYLALLGYQSNKRPFVYLFQFSPSIPFSDKYLYFDMPALVNTQLEGISFIDGNQLVISTEATNYFVQQVFSFNYSEYLSHF